MKRFIRKRLFQGFISLHILHHAGEEPVYGSWLIKELARHGYELSPGTLYPILHNLEKENLISHFEKNVNGKIRKYYIITDEGRREVAEAMTYITELADEIRPDKVHKKHGDKKDV